MSNKLLKFLENMYIHPRNQGQTCRVHIKQTLTKVLSQGCPAMYVHDIERPSHQDGQPRYTNEQKLTEMRSLASVHYV